MLKDIADRLRSINPWHFLWVTVILSQLFTAALNAIQSYLRWGFISSELLAIGALDALFVPVVVAPIIMIFVLRISKLREDIRLHEEFQKALRESENRYRSLFENMSEGLAYCRMIFENDRPQDFIYLEVNSAFEKLTGLKNVVGRKVTEVIPGIRESNPELFDIYGRVALTGKPESFEMFVEALKMWFSISVYSPERGFFVAVFDVITERKRAEGALRQRLDELERFMKETVQREFRIEELKKKIKVLEEQLRKETN